MLQSICLNGRISPNRHYYNVDEFGNTGAAGAPIVLSQNWNKFEQGDLLAITVVGSGLTWAGMLLSFEKN